MYLRTYVRTYVRTNVRTYLKQAVRSGGDDSRTLGSSGRAGTPGGLFASSHATTLRCKNKVTKSKSKLREKIQNQT